MWDVFLIVRTGAVSWEVGLGLADEQDGTQDISRVCLVEFLRSHTLDGSRGHDSRRVDNDINLQLPRLGVGRELVLARVDDGLCALWGADVGPAGHGDHIVLRGELLRELRRRLVRRLGQVADEDVGPLLRQVRGDGGADTCNPFPSVPCTRRAYFVFIQVVGSSRTACGASDNGKLAFVNPGSCHICQVLLILPRSVRIRNRG